MNANYYAKLATEIREIESGISTSRDDKYSPKRLESLVHLKLAASGLQSIAEALAQEEITSTGAAGGAGDGK
jgi:hypothetical protein